MPKTTPPQVDAILLTNPRYGPRRQLLRAELDAEALGDIF